MDVVVAVLGTFVLCSMAGMVVSAIWYFRAETQLKRIATTGVETLIKGLNAALTKDKEKNTRK